MSKVRGYIKCSVLTARKHAAVGLVKSAAMEDGEQGIRGNAVMPGAIDTPMRQKLIDEDAPPPILFSPIERPGHPNEIASVVAFFLSDESSYVTGALWSVNGGVNA
ncbi:putative short-chain alcohol dehydrogenase [Fusarium solani]|uniref:Short-chain alcohol dehydrogenase n=1 Tax=Fusarium solani TaxID=169388 RepID=A0A9P9L2W7_FUSSL|nr:putative short-chain alcohol dehydrogenase [Fusarium solani]KAH7273253.1 putative short-chain alcohol dehydrogenase [Fusarium solani]